MFEYEKYLKELLKIKDEEHKKWSDNIDDYDEFEKPFIEKRSILNKKYNIILKHDLNNAWQQSEAEFYIIDSDKDNIVIIKYGKKESYSISTNDINLIKEYLTNNNALFKKYDVAFPPVLDGTSHEIYISNDNNDIEIECSNLWYWMEEDVYSKYVNATEEERMYTKKLVELFKKIQKIITSNNIVYNILEIEEDEE